MTSPQVWVAKVMIREWFADGLSQFYAGLMLDQDTYVWKENTAKQATVQL